MTSTNRFNTPACRDISEIPDQLRLPDTDVQMVLDTDAYNEIDDQFALVYALLSESLNVEAVYAAPFHNQRSTGPADGMKKSYNEIIRLFELLECTDPEKLVFHGAIEYMSTSGTPVTNPATEDLIERTEDYSSEIPLYVVSIGAPTNVSSALERDPRIAEKIVVVWLGGQPYSWHTADEFNLRQDLLASQVLFDSGVPLVHVPCKNVAEHVRTTVPELKTHLSGRGELAEYLLRIFTKYEGRDDDQTVWSKEIWDLAPVAYLVEIGRAHV